MGEASRRYKAKAREIAIAFCANHPTRTDVDKEAELFEKLLKSGHLVVTRPGYEGGY